MYKSIIYIELLLRNALEAGLFTDLFKYVIIQIIVW